MKPSPAFLLSVNAFLAIGLTVLSLQYIQPKHCYNFCDPSYVIPCPKGSCYFGDQKAGWPLPVYIDSPGGGSPTGGWGFLGPEDPPSPFTMIGNVLFYSIPVWLVLCIIPFARRQSFSPKLFWASLSLNALLALGLWVFYFIFGFTLGYDLIGRGRRGSIYVETSGSGDIGSAMTFLPTVPIPLDEVIGYYGEPDYVRFPAESAAEGTKTSPFLYWDSVGIFVKLPLVGDKTYPVQGNTDIEMIIFYDDQEALALDGQLLSEEKTIWTGYGSYQP